MTSCKLFLVTDYFRTLSGPWSWKRRDSHVPAEVVELFSSPTRQEFHSPLVEKRSLAVYYLCNLLKASKHTMRGPVQAVSKPAVPDYSNALDKVWVSQVACLALALQATDSAEDCVHQC